MRINENYIIENGILSIDLGTMNFSYVCISIDNQRIYEWNNIELAKSTKESTERICTSLATQLRKLDLLRHFKKVIILIEMQPKINIRTITMGGQVQMFYVLQKLDNKNSPITKIIGYHAKNKLKFYKFKEGDEPLKLDHLKKGYYKNKQTSIQHCDRIIKREKEDPMFIKMFQSSKKKDDLADSYLQARSYIDCECNANSVTLESQKIADKIMNKKVEEEDSEESEEEDSLEEDTLEEDTLEEDSLEDTLE